MKKRVALLLALILVFTLASSVFARAGDDEGDNASGGNQLKVTEKMGPQSGLKIQSWLHVATNSFLEETFDDDFTDSVDLEMHVLDLGAGDMRWDGTVETVYSFTLEWEATPGAYSRSADTYSWNAKTLKYERTDSGAWRTVTQPTLKLTLTNRSNDSIGMIPSFVPVENVAAYMELGEESVLAAFSAAPPLVQDVDMAKEMAEYDNEPASGEGNIRAADDASEDTSDYSLTERTGEATSAVCDLSFTVLNGFGNIKDSIGTVTVSFETAGNMLAQADQSMLDYTNQNLLS